MFVAGIDVGLTGGVAFVPLCDGTASGVMMPLILPTTKSKARGDRREIDVVKLTRLLNTVHLIVVEKVWTRPVGVNAKGPEVGDKRRQGGVSNAKLMTLYGEVRAVLKLLQEQCGIPYIEVAPVAWKNAVLPDGAHDKAGAIAFARENYPGVELIPKPKKKPQDGIADALALAHYGLLLVRNPSRNLASKFPVLHEAMPDLRRRLAKLHS